ncbi:uncharacterized protein METZ01_LOCUS503031, partial [marine metagenome]
GSTVFDPFGKTEQSGLTDDGIIVYNYGRNHISLSSRIGVTV